MKNIVYLIIILFSIQTNGQNSIETKKFRVDLLTIKKNSNDTIRSAIIEVYSAEKRIETDNSDFDGISIFFIDSKDIVDNKIRLKIYGPKCKLFEKEFQLTENLNTKIFLEYGETEYINHNQKMEMLKKLNIQLEIGEE